MSKSQLKRLVAQGAIVTAKCVSCGARRDIKPGEIPPDDQPMCNQCGSPMVAESARRPA